MQKKLTIDLPESPETLRYLLKILAKLGLITDQKARSLETSAGASEQASKSRWAHAAERLQQEGFLKGKGDEVKRLTRDFRKDFDL
jgi:hypothetical protein